MFWAVPLLVFVANGSVGSGMGIGVTLAAAMDNARRVGLGLSF